MPASQYKEKEKLFSSVLKVLTSDTELGNSFARVHAQVLRASARCNAHLYDEALLDTKEAIGVVEDCQKQQESSASSSSSALSLLSARAYRIQAEAYEGLGRIPEAIESLRQWAKCDESFRTKVMNEIQRLQQQLQ